MDYGLQLTTPPAVEPLSLGEAKLHLRVTDTDEDALIQSAIAAARKQFEEATYRQLITATYELTLPRFPKGKRPIVVPRAPLQSVGGITYLDSAGNEQTLATSRYVVTASRQPGLVWPAFGYTWPTTYEHPAAVTVTFDAGYGDAADDVDDLIKAAMRLMIGQAYEFREQLISGTIVNEIPTGAQRIVAMYDLGDELTEYGATGQCST